MTNTNYAVAPGAYLEESIDENDLSQQRVADMLGCSRKQVNEIINARAPITPDTAMRLERVVGIPADAWLRYEAMYKADQTRIAEEQELAKYAEQIDPQAAKYLRKIGATKATRTSPVSWSPTSWPSTDAELGAHISYSTRRRTRVTTQ